MTSIRSIKLKFPSHILKVVLPAHVAFLFGVVLLFGSGLKAQFMLYFFLGWFCISGLGVAIGFHRLLSHNSFETYAWIKYTLAYLGSLGGQGTAIFWSLFHGKVHHAHSDQEKDLHSPIHGHWQAYMGWQFVVNSSHLPKRDFVKMAKDPYLRFLHVHYYKTLWGTGALLFFIDPQLFYYGFIFPMVLSIHQGNLINWICHQPWGGYQNFETKDRSVNNIFFGLLSFGQGWHNNHHAFPKRYNYGGERWWEFDICAYIVPILKKRDKHSKKVKVIA